jgi:ribosomal protein S18 acetylase RimI-like enzyme
MTPIQSRNATAADEPMLYTLFAAAKSLEFAPLGWPAEQLQPLLRMQFRARQQSWAQVYPTAVDSILCLEDGTPVGRHLVDRQANSYRSVDLAILPEHRNRGFGTWAIQQGQRLAASEAIAMRLRAERTNPALRLYERLGFRKISEDEFAFEMEWQQQQPILAPQPAPPNEVSIDSAEPMPRFEILDRIFAFLRELGLSVEFGPVPDGFLPGVRMVRGGLRVDLETLLYPGDLLHEAGHLAAMTPGRRFTDFPSSSDPAEEMAAIAWSYAAALHTGIPPEIVLHPNGYRGQATGLLQQFRSGNCIGLPILWWYGLTTRPVGGTPSIYPKMLHWLRETQVDTEATMPSIPA